MSDWIGSSSSDLVRIPAVFHGTARLLDGTETPTPPRPPRHDDVEGVFEAELEITFALLFGAGWVPVHPSHPAYPLYLAASTAPEPPASPVYDIDPNHPDTVIMPFETVVIIPEERALRFGLVAPGHPATQAPAPTQPARRTGVPPPIHAGPGADRREKPPPVVDFDAFLAFMGDPDRHPLRATGDAQPDAAAESSVDAQAAPDAASAAVRSGVEPRAHTADKSTSVIAGAGSRGGRNWQDPAALSEAAPFFDTGHGVLDIVMAPDAEFPPAIRAVIGSVGGGRAGQASAKRAAMSGADVDDDVAALLHGMQDADRSPGGVEVAQLGESDAATLPRAKNKPAAAAGGHPSTSSVSPALRRVSNAGRAFIEKREEEPGVSNTLRHPSQTSGVTLGPGYDMKNKSAAQIIADLERIGVASDVAEKISKASHLPSGQIEKFVKNNKSLINLTSDQQARLLASTIGPYEDKVRRDIRVPLKPDQFDALVSFLYNPGLGWPAVREAVNNGNFQAAAQVMTMETKSGGKVLRALVERRRRETDLLLNGDYGTEE